MPQTPFTGLGGRPGWLAARRLQQELPTGIYFARLEAGEYVGIQKMVLLK